jgi:hypothetical protein
MRAVLTANAVKARKEKAAMPEDWSGSAACFFREA